MNRTDAEKIITEYLNPIFGFALKRCRSIHDAEDLSQEIAARAYRAFLAKDDIDDTGKYIRTVAHNTLSNYYRIPQSLPTSYRSMIFQNGSLSRKTRWTATRPMRHFPVCRPRSHIFLSCNGASW